MKATPQSFQTGAPKPIGGKLGYELSQSQSVKLRASSTDVKTTFEADLKPSASNFKKLGADLKAAEKIPANFAHKIPKQMAMPAKMQDFVSMLQGQKTLQAKARTAKKADQYEPVSEFKLK